MTSEVRPRAWVTRKRGWDLARGCARPWVVTAFALGCSAACGQRWQSDVTLTGDLSTTTNSRLSLSESQSDLVGSLRPRVSVLSEGPRYKLSAIAAANGVVYTQGTRDNKVYPEADVRLTVVPVERFFSIDGAVRVSQAFADPFTSRVNDGTAVSEDAITTTQVSLSPTLEFTLVPLDLRVFARSENVRLYDDADAGQTTGRSSGGSARHSALVESLSRPLSFGVSAERSETRYDDAVQGRQTIDNARFKVDYWFNDQFSAGLRVGREDNNFVTGQEVGRVYGGQFAWRPSERTTLGGFAEKRFFGTGGRFDFTHRMPWLAWNASLGRDISTTPQELFALPATDNVAGLLDAALTTRFPDPFERARQVQDLITRSGLPSRLLGPTVIYDQRLSLRTLAMLGVAYIGVRHSVALNASYGKVQDVPGAVGLAAGTLLNNNIQNAVGVAATQRLSPTTTLGAEVTRTVTRTTASSLLPRSAQQRNVALTLQRQLSPRTGVRLRARYMQLIQNGSDDHEAAVIAGFDHRF